MSITTFIEEKKNEFNEFKQEFKDELKEKLKAEAYEQYEKHIGKIDENNPRWNNDVDAYRHAYVAGRLTQILLDNQWAAEIILDSHEVHSDNVPYEHRMDGWNNEVGRRFGDEYSSEELGKKLAEELQEGGLLVTSPNDPRLEALYSDDPKLKDPKLIDRSLDGQAGVSEKEMDQITDDASTEIDALMESHANSNSLDTTAKAHEIINKMNLSHDTHSNDYGKDPSD